MITLKYMIADGYFWKNFKDMMAAKTALAYSTIAAVTTWTTALYVLIH